jgi:hypothetical protein
MQYQEILLTLAEASVAFVGFGGVVGVFGISRSGEAIAADRGRIRNLGEIGMLLFGLSLLPLLLGEAELSRPWKTSSGVFLVVWGALTFRAIPRWIRLSRRGGYALDWVFWCLNGAIALSLVILLGNVLDLWKALSTAYMICLASPLAVVLVSFFRLLWSFFPMEAN